MTTERLGRIAWMVGLVILIAAPFVGPLQPTQGGDLGRLLTVAAVAVHLLAVSLGNQRLQIGGWDIVDEAGEYGVGQIGVGQASPRLIPDLFLSNGLHLSGLMA